MSEMSLKKRHGHQLKKERYTMSQRKYQANRFGLKQYSTSRNTYSPTIQIPRDYN